MNHPLNSILLIFSIFLFLKCKPFFCNIFPSSFCFIPSHPVCAAWSPRITLQSFNSTKCVLLHNRKPISSFRPRLLHFINCSFLFLNNVLTVAGQKVTAKSQQSFDKLNPISEASWCASCNLYKLIILLFTKPTICKVPTKSVCIIKDLYVSDIFDEIIFFILGVCQQDGASCHVSLWVREFLNKIFRDEWNF